MTSEDHERRITALETSRAEQWEKINEMHTMIKVLCDRSERAPILPCAQHRLEIAKIDERLRKVESTGNRFSGAWDFAKIGFGALIPVLLWALSRLPIN